MKSTSRAAYAWLYAACLVAVGVMIGIIGPSLGALGRQTGQNLKGISLILALRPLGYMAGALLCGQLLDRLRGHPILAAACLVALLALAAMPLSPSLGLLAVLILLMGLAQALLDVGSNTLLLWVYHGEAGPVMNALHFAFALGALLGPVLVALSLALSGGHAWAYWALSLSLLPLLAALLSVPSPTRRKEKKNAEAPPAPGGLLLGFMAAFFLYSGSEAAFGAWIYSYATALGLAGPGAAAYLNALFWALLGAGRLAGIPLTARYSARRLLLAVLPLAPLSLAFLLLAPPSRANLWLGSIGVGLGLSCIFPTLLVFAGQRLSGGRRISGRANSLFFLGASSGCVALPWLMGQVFEPGGPRLAMGIPLAGMALLGLLLTAILRRQD